MKKFFIRWKWFTMAITAIVILSLAPIPDNAPLEDVPLIDKWVHFVIYAGLVFAAWFDRWQNKSTIGWWTFAILICLFSSLLGGLLEWAQGCTNYRSCELLDFYADTIGALLATFIIVVGHLLQGADRHRPF
jgi:VanZ family protein